MRAAAGTICDTVDVAEKTKNLFPMHFEYVDYPMPHEKQFC